MLKARLQEFLLLGVRRSTEGRAEAVESVSSIRDAAEGLLAEWSRGKAAEQARRDTLAAFHASVKAEKEQLLSLDILGKYKQYRLLTIKIQLLQVADSLRRLKGYCDICEIPALVLEVYERVPRALPPHARINLMLKDIVAQLRLELLKQFHAQFEEHLNESNTSDQQQQQQERSSSGISDAGAVWVAFLSSAKDWLLAYALVSLLPAALSESQARVLELYQEVLDEALTPMWGRFRFHLTAAREDASEEQLMWTFKYAQSFLQLLYDLCSHITSAGGRLQQLCEGNYHEAGQQHLTDKTARILRAHLAQVLVDHQPISSSFCMQLVDKVLEIDLFLSKGGTQPSTLVCTVLYDAREVHTTWLFADFGRVKDLVVKSCANLSQVFSSAFGSETLVESEHATTTGGGGGGGGGGEEELYNTSSAKPMRSRRRNEHRCYKATYDLLSLFLLASERYRFLPPGSQDLFAEFVLEPVLATAVSLFLLRIRSDPVLWNIWHGMLPDSCRYLLVRVKNEQKAQRNALFNPSSSSSSTSSSPPLINFRKYYPAELLEFVDAVSYFEASLNSSAGRLVRAKTGRFEDKWKETCSWLPRKLCGERRELYETEFSPKHLALHIMSPPSLLPSMTSASTAAGTVGFVVDPARHLVLQLSFQLEKQLRSCFANSR